MTDGCIQSLIHNTVGGKCNRGLSVVDSERLLLDRELVPDEYLRAAMLGWMIELLQAMMLVLDDIMDSSKTRRGKLCWYLVPKIGMAAVNDATMLESAIYMLLKKYFKHHPAYVSSPCLLVVSIQASSNVELRMQVDMIELFHEVAFKTELGQTYDMLTAPEDDVNLNNFNLDKYTEIVIFKTAYYSFYLPVALALYDTGKATLQNLKQAEDILISIGEYFQVQDDYLDAFADPSVLGKIGTDIQDNKCSWLVNQALQRCSSDQRRVLQENYGRKSDEHEKVVKLLYHELRLEGVYNEYEEAKMTDIRQMIANVDESQGLKRSVFEELLQKIQKRSK